MKVPPEIEHDKLSVASVPGIYARYVQVPSIPHCAELGHKHTHYPAHRRVQAYVCPYKQVPV